MAIESRNELEGEGRSFLFRFAAPLSCLVLIVAMFFGGLASASGNTATPSNHLRVGSELEFPPYAFVDEQGQPAGFSVDLIKAVAGAMGMSIDISTGSWDSVWSSLVAGRLDLLPIVAKLPGRPQLVDFSLPHTETYDAFFVQKGNPLIPDIEAARGREIVVMRSDAAHHALLERKFDNLILVDTIPQGLSLISSGAHDAFLCSKLIGTLAIKKHGLKGLVSGPPIPDYKRVFSLAVKKGDSELLEKLNQGLLIIKTNGDYERIYDRWLASDDPWRKWQEYFMPAVATVMAVGLLLGFWLVMLKLQVRKRTHELAERNEMLLKARDSLEERVAQRTAELKRANTALQSEVNERKQMEEAVRKSRDELELRVQERTADLNMTVFRLEQLNRELQEFAFVASHDLQEPLRKIQIFCDMAQKRCAPALDATSREYLDRVFSSAARMRELLRDLLLFSTVATNSQPFKQLDLGALAREAADVFEALIKETSCLIEIENMPAIEADESQMLRLFQNLIGNALKFRRDTAPHVRVYGALDGKGGCEIFVEDNGIGFDQQYAERIFRPCQRLHGKNEYSGTGIGLAICRKIVERHGGTIKAGSEPGKGSTFIVRLPVRQIYMERTLDARR
jgi:signal transduction histidine kinase